MYNIGTNYSNIIELTPYQHCQNSRFLIRVWLNNPIINEYWSTPPWVSVNQTSSSIQIDLSKVSLVNDYTVTFQSQLIVDPQMFNDSSLYMNTDSCLISFANENSQLISNTNDWFIITGITKTYQIFFSDTENDSLSISLLETGGINAFIQSVNRTTFNFILSWNEDSIQSSEIRISYTDKYHKSAEYLMYK